MSNKFSKEFVSLLASIVTQVCDDSEDEDLLPLKAAQEYLSTLKRKREQKAADSKKAEEEAKAAKELSERPSEQKKLQVLTEHSYFTSENNKEAEGEEGEGAAKKLKSLPPYATLSMFEDPSVANRQFHFKKGKLCTVTLKTASECLCSIHREQREVDSQLRLSLTSLDFDLKSLCKMQLSTIEEIYCLIHKCNNSLGAMVSPEGLLAVLFSLTTEESAGDISSRFKMTEADLSSQQRYVMDSLLTMKPQFECWPSGSAVDKTKAGFLALGGLPDIIGSVACVHFQCNVEGVSNPENCVNINGETTVVFLLVCNHRGSFIYTSYFWWPGKMRDKEIYYESSLHSYPMPPKSYLAGNRCFASIPGVLTPYYEPMDSRGLLFNTRHGKAHEVMCKSVSGLASRFSSLRVVEIWNPWKLRKKLNSCLILHNICNELEDDIELDGFLPLGAYFPPPPVPDAPDAENDCREIMSSTL